MIGLALVDLIWPFEIQLQSSVLEDLILIFYSSMVFFVVKAVVAAQIQGIILQKIDSAGPWP